MRNKPRSRSAPPFCPRDFGPGWELREDGIETEDLQMDSADLAEFSTVEIFIDYHPRSMYWVDNDKVLKLFSYLIDVSVIVANMDLARTRIPVPRVLRYGQSGNCSYILMERIPYPNLEFEMQRLSIKSMPWGLTRAIDYIVRELANLGLSHNDLVPRNVLVDNNGMIVSIIDWDPSTQHHRGGEYARKIRELSYFKDVEEEDWYHIFLRYAPDRTGEEIIIGCSKWHSKLRLQWPLVKCTASQIVSSPGLDPRNQSFSRQKIHPITIEPVGATFHSNSTHIGNSACLNIIA
ncbi:MAG: kinase-like domain-containing protein [Lentinula lateritia]|uniref:Kinase-like domain-containing protein n=1 Tax=Lentinula lateritia TaxID=40482 RepID=A0ABQ8VWN3_9AGAR|nr:MAG: kinase-like domain-containing protein [Lentinula lateritia]KAJ4500797.1 kinase-like domain-containing protein [Lentinula lateritia]